MGASTRALSAGSPWDSSAGAFVNVYPLARGGYTEVLTALHLPIALGLLVAIAYAGGRWREVAGRMDFIRFAGEFLIYYVLIALGGGVLTAFIGRLLAGRGQAERHREHGARVDTPQVVLLAGALLTDAVALWAIATRITGFGFSPNRVAALGENVILLVNLAWSVVLYTRFLRGRASFSSLERWQTDYLPVYAAWAAVVVIVFPPVFRYI